MAALSSDTENSGRLDPSRVALAAVSATITPALFASHSMIHEGASYNGQVMRAFPGFLAGARHECASHRVGRARARAGLGLVGKPPAGQALLRARQCRDRRG